MRERARLRMTEGTQVRFFEGGKMSMNVNGINGINNGSYMPVQKRESPKTGNTAPGFQNSFNGVHTLVMGGLCSRGLVDGGCVTVYKADGYSTENPIMRVVTRAADGQEYEQLVDPAKVDPASATRTEIDALAAYLVDEKKLDSMSALRVGAGAEKGTESFSTAFAEKKNYYAIAEEMMKMQYECHNLAGYASYQKILSAFDAFMDKD